MDADSKTWWWTPRRPTPPRRAQPQRRGRPAGSAAPSPKHGTDDAPRDCAWCASFRPKTRRLAVYCSRDCLEADRVGSGRARESYLARTYGITHDDYARMLAEQGGGCAICGKRPEEQERYSKYLFF